MPSTSRSESFVDIGARYGSDKGTYHRYYEVYDTLLARHRKPGVRVLELGVLTGESMKVWVDAFPRAEEIIGIDAHVHPDLTVGKGWTFYQDDAYMYETVEWARKRGPFDVIIDDGPHSWDTQRFVLEEYTDLLAPRGTLVIEDIGVPSWIQQLSGFIPEHLQRFAFGVDRRIAPGALGEDLMLVVDITS